MLLDPGALDEFVERLVAAAGVQRGGVLHERGGTKSIRASSGFPTEATTAYNCHFEKLDRLVPGEAGAPIVFNRRTAEHYWPDYTRGTFYNEWSLPNEVPHVAFATVDLPDRSRTTLLLGLTRDQRNASRPAALLDLMAPHFRRTMLAADRLDRLDRRDEHLLAALERWSCGAVVIDGRGRCHANAAALEIMRMRDGLNLSMEGLRAAHPAANRALQALVAEAWRVFAGEAGSSLPVPVPRPSMAPPFLVDAFPLHRPGSGIEDRAVMLVIVDPAARPRGQGEVIRVALGLTRAETAVALSLLDGLGLKAAADDLGITHATARTHLQRIFHKTGTTRQAELVLMLARLGASVRPEG